MGVVCRAKVVGIATLESRVYLARIEQDAGGGLVVHAEIGGRVDENVRLVLV